MAEDATILKAVQTLHRVLSEYDESYSVDALPDELTPDLFDSIEKFTSAFREINDISVAVNNSGATLGGIYDTALGEAVNTFVTSDTFSTFKEKLESGNILEAVQLLNRWDAPALFLDNPQLLVSLATASNDSLGDFVGALNVLEDAGQLNQRPREFTPEELEKQPEAIAAIETQLKEDLGFFVDTMQAEIDRATEELEALPEDATDADKQALETRIENIANGMAKLKTSYEAIKDLEVGGEFDQAFQDALTVYTSFLQKGNSLTYYIKDSFGGGVPTAEDYVDISGNYTANYEEYLQARLESYQTVREELEGKDERTSEEEYKLQSLIRAEQLTENMTLLVESGLYDQPAPTEPADEPEMIPVDQARPIIEAAIEYMTKRTDQVEVTPKLGDEDDGAFDLASRIALQAFMIDLKNTLDIDIERDSGVYSREFRTALETKLSDAATRRRVADLYFKGDEAAVLQLVSALDTYANDADVANLPGAFKANIGDTELISMPQFKGNETQLLKTSIDRIPADEMGAMNEMMITLTGFGMEDFMPEGSLTEEQIKALEHSGQSREEVLGDFFKSVEAEARAALERDGRPMSELGAEMEERMVERFNNLVEDNAAFNVIRAEWMRRYIGEAVEAGLAADENSEPNADIRSEDRAFAFANTLPTAEEFLQEHGANRRSYFVYDQDDMVGVTPEVLAGFGGQVAKEDASLAQALEGQTMASLISDMEEDFEYLDSSAIARRTMAEVRAELVEKEALLERVYNDPTNADNKNADGVMIVTDRNGETVMLSQGAEGFEVRYLDVAGIEGVSDFDKDVVQLGEELDFDQVLIKTAMAGYQSQNQGADGTRTHNPEFFEMGGENYIVGIDKETNSIQVIRIDQEVFNSSNAASITYATTQERSIEEQAKLMNDPAYRFIQEQYPIQFGGYGTRDPVFQAITTELAKGGSVDADTAMAVMAEFYEIDWANLQTVADAPEVTDGVVLWRANNMAESRPEESRIEPFIFLKEGGDPQILVVIPARKEEIVTNEDGTESTVIVYDGDRPPAVRDISDPEIFTSLREEFITMDVINQEALETEAYKELHDWMIAGGRPPLKQDPEVIAYGPASEEGLASMFTSAAGFTSEGRDLEFGAAITETEALVEVLGYDPNLVFDESQILDRANTYIVHGADPENWNGSDAHHEFLKDHVLVTFQRGSEEEENIEVVTVALSKDDINNNPRRISMLIGMDHEQEPRARPTIYAVDRDRITTSEEGTFYSLRNFDTLIHEGVPTLEQGEAMQHTQYWQNNEEWRRDITLFQRALVAEEAAERESDPVPLHKALSDNIVDITAPRDELSPVDRALSPANNISPAATH